MGVKKANLSYPEYTIRKYFGFNAKQYCITQGICQSKPPRVHHMNRCWLNCIHHPGINQFGIIPSILYGWPIQ